MTDSTVLNGMPSMKFHNFFRWFCLPITILLFAYQAYTYITPGLSLSTEFDYIIGAEAALICLRLLLALLAFVGFFWMTKYSLVSVYLFWALNIIYSALELYVVLRYGLSDQLYVAAGQIAGAVLWGIIVIVYYNKRKALFDGVPLKQKQAQYQSAHPAGAPYYAVPTETAPQDGPTATVYSAEPRRFCMHCGAQLTGGKFCINCGTKI